MKIETQQLEDNQIKLIAEVESDLFERSKRQAARKISQETKVPGFRPGKAPFEVIKRLVGEDAIVKEAMGLLVDEVYPKVLEQAEITPYGPGSLEEVVSMDPVTFAFVVPLLPKVDLGDYRSLRENYEPRSLDEKEVDQFIDRMRYNYATIQPAERPAQEGDLVFITLNGRVIQPEEGEEPTIVENRPMQVTIRPAGEQQDQEYPFVGFANQLVGLSAGGNKTITHTFPEDSPFENFKGKEIEFTVTVQSVKDLEIPPLNDEFAQSLGEFDNVDALTEAVRKSLSTNIQEEYDREFFTKIIDQVGEQATITYPPQALEEEVQEVLKGIERDLARQNLDLDTYLKIREQDREAFIEQEVKPAAIKRLHRSLLIDEIARTEEIKFEDHEFEDTYNQTLAEFQHSEDFENMRKKVPAERLANVIAMETATRLMNHHVFERLKLIVTGQSDKEVVPPEQKQLDTSSEISNPSEVEAQIETVSGKTNEEIEPNE